MALLRIDRVSKAFGETVLFANLSLEIKPGAVHYLRGPNGSGKSTFLKGLVGRVPLDRGRVSMNGTPIHTLPDWQIESRLPMVDQDPRLEMGVPAIDHLVDAVTLGDGWHWLIARRKKIRHRSREQMASLLQALGISEAVDRPTIELSFGQQKLLTLARALRPLADGSPRALLLDEPLAGIRRQRFDAILGLLRERLERGWSILVAEHLEAIYGLGSGHVITFPVSEPSR